MRIDLLPAAREDLREIWRFGALNWSIAQADRYSDELDAAISSLTENPRKASRTVGLGRGMRRLVFRSHVVFYRVKEGKIAVVRVLHQSVEARARLGKPLE